MADELYEEADRLIETDEDLRHLLELDLSELSPYALTPSLGDLRAKAKRARLIEEHPAQQLRYLVITGGFSFLLLGAITWALSSDTLAGWPLFVQIVVVALVFGVGAFFVWGVMTDKGRSALQALVEPDVEGAGWRVFTLALITLWILAFATLGFAGVSELLYLREVATTDRQLDDPFGDSVLFYVWSFLNAIPVLEIPQTLRWDLDFEFTDRLSPVLLLVYKIAVIGPVIVTGRLAWKSREQVRAEPA